MGKWLLVAWAVVTTVLVVPDMHRFATEYGRIAGLAERYAAGATSPRQLAQNYSDAVHHRIKVEGAGKWLNYMDRPFLRPTAWETWSQARGACGEASRVMINMLLSQGVPATRINMVGPRFTHTAVAYKDGNAWYLVDSINGPASFRDWSRSNELPVSDLVALYFHPGGGTRVDVNNPYFERYSFFNWSRLFHWAEVNQRVPFPIPITMLIENPPLLTGLVKLGVALVVLVFGWIVWRRQRRAGGRETTAIAVAPSRRS